MLPYIIAWFIMLILAVSNGIARDVWYKKEMTEFRARQLSVVTLLILFSFCIYFVIENYPPVSAGQAVLIGVLWLILTLCFEFGFGMARGKSFNELIKEYDISKGNLWILIPVWVTIAPVIFYLIKANHD